MMDLPSVFPKKSLEVAQELELELLKVLNTTLDSNIGSKISEKISKSFFKLNKFVYSFKTQNNNNDIEMTEKNVQNDCETIIKIENVENLSNPNIISLETNPVLTHTETHIASDIESLNENIDFHAFNCTFPDCEQSFYTLQSLNEHKKNNHMELFFFF